MSIELRTARTADVGEIIALARGSYDRALHPFLTFVQPGAEAYLNVLVEYSGRLPDRRFLVAESHEGGLLGFAEFRELEDHRWHLSHLFVAPRARRQGIATKLIERGASAEFGVTSLGLRVFRHNTPAITLYERLGFAQVRESVWWQAPIATATAASTRDLRFDDLPAALAGFERLGFCHLRGTFRGRPFQVGRTSASVFRCYTGDDFDDPDLLSALASLFPAALTAMMILPETVTDVPSHAQELVRSVEMERT